jgi:hypothetical protein
LTARIQNNIGRIHPAAGCTYEERRRREVMLARVMLLAIDVVLAGEPLALETARDLFREVRHTYPELVDELYR